MTDFYEIKVNGKIDVKWDGRLSCCKLCGKRIAWGTTVNGKKLPFDTEKGLYMSHFSGCSKRTKLKK